MVITSMAQHVEPATCQKMALAVFLVYATLIWTAQCDSTSCSSSVLHQAVIHHDIVLLKDAIQRGVDLYLRDCNGKTAMDLALELGNEEAINTLLEGSYNLDVVDEQGNTLLFSAVRRGDLHLVQKLLELGSSVDFLSANGSTPFFEALLSGIDDIVEVMLRAGAELEFRLPGGNSYLHQVVDIGNFKAALKLLKLNVTLDPENNEDETPLSKAVLKDNPAFVNLLLSRGAYLRRKDKNRETYLHLAVKQNCIIVLPILIRKGIHVDYESKQGVTPLFYAVMENNREIVNYLKDSGADLRYTNKYGYTYLQMVIRNTTLLTRFLEFGVDPNVQDVDGNTAFRSGVEYDQIDALDVLSKYGLEVNKTFTLRVPFVEVVENATFLHLAAANGSSKAIEWLVRHGAVIDAGSPSFTPLDVAVLHDNVGSAEILLELGACQDYEASGCEHSYQLAKMYNKNLAQLIHSKKKIKNLSNFQETFF